MCNVTTTSAMLEMTASRFGGLSIGETRLLKAAVNRQDADCSDLHVTSRVVRADVLAWLCRSAAEIGIQMLSIRGALVEGPLDLAWARVSVPVQVINSTFLSEIVLKHAHIFFLDLSGSSIASLEASGAVFDNSVLLNEGFKCMGKVDFAEASMGRNLECNGSTLFGQGQSLAFDATGITVQGGIHLGSGFKAFQGVSLVGASILGNLDCRSGTFSGSVNSNGSALDLVDAKIGTSVLLSKGFAAVGGVDLRGASIGRNVECGGGVFVAGVKGFALDASNVRVDGDVCLHADFRAEGGANVMDAAIAGALDCSGGKFYSARGTPALAANRVKIGRGVSMTKGFEAEGGVSLETAKIEADLDCDDGTFKRQSQTLAFDANGVEVGGSVFLRSAVIDGGAEFVGARIGRNLECDRADIIAAAGTSALSANGAEIEGHVFLRDRFRADGGVDFVAARIAGNLVCEAGEFIGRREAIALDGDGIELKGHVFMRCGFKAYGGVDFGNADIGGNLGCDGGEFVGNGDVAGLAVNGARIGGYALLRDGFIADGTVSFVNASVSRTFRLCDIGCPEKANLDLRLMKAGALLNSQDSRPKQGNLRVDGFVYEQIEDEAPVSAKSQLDWLGRQPRDKFLSQPFEQLADVLRKMGLEEDVRQVLVAKNNEQARHVRWRLPWLWYGLFGKLIGYGYRPWRAFWISAIFILLGSVGFKYGHDLKVIRPPEARAYVDGKGEGDKVLRVHPRFNSFAYSAETFVPLLKLGISQYWAPNPKGRIQRDPGIQRSLSGNFFRYYLWFHIIAGWILSALWVGAITGIAKT
jgi:hypothetical protein